jgi:hypothetical protein
MPPAPLEGGLKNISNSIFMKRHAAKPPYTISWNFVARSSDIIATSGCLSTCSLAMEKNKKNRGVAWH